MITILPGILEQDFSKALEKFNMVKDLVDWIHVDVLDGTMIDNKTFNDWDKWQEISSQINLESHLMVSDPVKYVQPMANAGFKRLIAQIEGNTIRDFIHEAQVAEVEVGVSIDGPTSFEALEPYLDQVDCVLVMMYRAGFSGQTYQPEQLEKIKAIKKEYPDMPIEVDGGTDDQTAPQSIAAGATRLVSTSYLYWKNKDDISGAIEGLKRSD